MLDSVVGTPTSKRHDDPRSDSLFNSRNGHSGVRLARIGSTQSTSDADSVTHTPLNFDTVGYSGIRLGVKRII